MNATTYRHWRLETSEQAITWAYIDVAESRVNVLSGEVLDELRDIVNGLARDRPRGLILSSAKSSGFIAGADVKEFRAMVSSTEIARRMEQVHELLDQLERLPFPTVARIHGFCLGGGFELALACRHRVASDEPATRIGFPEVQLGIHPAYGGTVRAIRYAGPMAALDMMLTGRAIDARKAQRLRLVDRAVPLRHLDEAALHFASGAHARLHVPLVARIANSAAGRAVLAPVVRSRVAKRADPRHYPAPFAIVDLWQQHGGSEAVMLREERRSAVRLFETDTARNLLRVFFLQERMKAIGRGADKKARRVHVIGAGTMGGDIAAWCAYKGCYVTLQDREPRFIAPAMERAYKYYQQHIRDRRARTAALDRLVPDIHGYGIRRADVVIEAIVENLDAKRQLFADVEPKLKAGALLATNTSSIPLEQLAQGLKDPARLVGLHFFNPVARMQLVEIISAASTSADAASQAAQFTTAIDRLPLPVKSSPGFLINRILMPYMLEGFTLVETGTPAETVDRAMRQFGMPMGPIELADTVGLDICLAVARVLAAQLGGHVPAILSQKVEQGRLGRKTQRGFYEYRAGKKVGAGARQSAEHLDDITDRLLARLLNEAIACLREGVVQDADLLDAGMIFGTGFAPFRGGPMQFLRARGIDAMKARVRDLAPQFGAGFAIDEGWNTPALIEPAAPEG